MKPLCTPSSGWRRNALLFLLGVFAVLALPPFFLFPFLVPSFAGLYVLITGAPSAKRAFFDGWWWGMGFYVAGLYWFCIALLVDPEKFAWLIPFTLIGLNAIIALYPAIASWLTWRLRARGLAGIFVFAVVWTLVEYARGHLFSGFPWNLPGYSFAAFDASMQLASVIGIYGLTFFAVWLATLPAAFTDRALARQKIIYAVGLPYLVLLLSVGWGAFRLHEADQRPDAEQTVPAVRLRLVQGNIPQNLKWDPERSRQDLQTYLHMTEIPGLATITYVIWPETAVPYIVVPDSKLTQLLGNALTPETLLITGALRAEGKPPEGRIFNSVIAIDHTGTIVGSYDKKHLVPFGEFLPLRSFLPKWATTPAGDMDFSQGTGPATLDLAERAIGPLICYEAIFPEMAVTAEHRPQLLINVTNDAWFGKSSGPYQHFHMARMRAAEQGIPLARAANTGISAIIDPFGRAVASLPLGEAGVMDEPLPAALPPTTYELCGKYFLLLLIVSAALLMIQQQRLMKTLR